jgi:hypothetical protein
MALAFARRFVYSSEARWPHNEKGFPGSLRIAALIALLAGGAGSVVLALRAGQRTPAFLLVIMVVWVLAPLAALLWATSISARWSVPIRWALSVLSIVLSVASVAIYGEFVDLTPRGSAYAARFVNDAGCDVAADGDRRRDGCRHLPEGIAPLTG